jgi:hypothetical protein
MYCSFGFENENLFFEQRLFEDESDWRCLFSPSLIFGLGDFGVWLWLWLWWPRFISRINKQLLGGSFS